jgi:chorismate dehydratase
VFHDMDKHQPSVEAVYGLGRQPASTEAVQVPARSSEVVDQVRIGMVNYINVAPIYEPWKRRGVRDNWQVAEAPPAILNRMLAAGELDLGFVSCIEYARHPWLYRILPDLSISANGPVGSVFLFSRTPLKKLDDQLVLLSSESETSVLLTKVVLEEFFGVKPCYATGEVRGQHRQRCEALLAIGDEALRLKEDGEFAFQFDLGEIWKKHTGLPFVFAVCAVREDFCLRQPLQLATVYQRLCECRDEGRSRLRDICTIAAPRIPMEVNDCFAYLKGIEYDLGEEKQEALVRFFSSLARRGDVDPNALPLNIHRWR